MNAALIGSIIYNYYYYKNEDDKMTDHKFEGEKVKKALRCCAQPDPICKECPYYDADLKYPCADQLKWAALNVIDRQEAELEDLREIVFMDRSEAIKNLKSEAIKEFAERAIDLAVCKDNGDGTERMFVSIANLRKIAKEMTEGGE